MKKKQKMTALLMAAVFSLVATGCAGNQIPDMTDEQIQAVGEFVAVKLMKYDAGHRSRLMDLSEYQEVEKPEVSQGQPGDQKNDASGGMKPADDTPVVDSTGMNPINSLEDVLEFPEGVTLQYTGEKLCAYYPEDDGTPYFSLNATEGKKLLVLSFSVANTTGQEQELDLLSQDVSFTIGVNGNYIRKSLTTLMENDLATYRDTLPAGEAREVVLIIEVEESMAENISSISLGAKNGANAYTVQLL